MLFQVYCHEDSKCSLKVVGQEKVQHFNNVMEAVEAARELSDTGDSPLTVYSTSGTVIFELLV
ncbi:MAG: hypothetical protein P4L99_06700 [Chthoniobacter sp.]|nr:hypothetical protein [Chthoniobacter sp.]